MPASSDSPRATTALPPGELEVRAGWLLAALGLALFPIIAASLVFGLMSTTFGWLATTKRHPQGRQVLVAGAAATVLGLVLGLLWHFIVKSGR
jgi:preprotein translocase subunit SecY